MTGFSVAPHLWGSIPLSDIGLTPESCRNLSVTLGLKPEDLTPAMTLEETAKKVEKDSPLDMRVETEPMWALNF